MRRLAELTSPEAADRLEAASLIIQPIGAVEQHGGHLPLITDTLVIDAVADAAIERCGDEIDAWLMEPISYGKSNEHEWAAGTVSMSTATTLGMLGDVGRSVMRSPARNLVFLNGHGGNNALLATAARDLRVELDLCTYVIHAFLVYGDPDDGDSTDFHGGQSETSVVAHLRPDLVRWDKAVADDLRTLHSNKHLRLEGTVEFGWRSNDFGDGTGILGDPSKANAEFGRKLFDEMVNYTVEALRECAAHRFPS